ncbi:uncharacterized protein LOC144560253 [Carex rostrata]
MGLTGVRSESKSKDSKSSSMRKVEKKLGFYNKVQDAIVKKETKTKKLRTRQKKLKAYNLSALAEFLPDLETLAKTKETAVIKDEKINCKSRQSLVYVLFNLFLTSKMLYPSCYSFSVLNLPIWVSCQIQGFGLLGFLFLTFSAYSIYLQASYVMELIYSAECDVIDAAFMATDPSIADSGSSFASSSTRSIVRVD